MNIVVHWKVEVILLLLSESQSADHALWEERLSNTWLFCWCWTVDYYMVPEWAAVWVGKFMTIDTVWDFELFGKDGCQCSSKSGTHNKKGFSCRGWVVVGFWVDRSADPNRSPCVILISGISWGALWSMMMMLMTNHLSSSAGDVFLIAQPNCIPL